MEITIKWQSLKQPHTHILHEKKEEKKLQQNWTFGKIKKKIGNVFGDPRIESLFAFQMVVVITVNFVLA